ncbi:MAG TPA: phosphate-starvation-inducible PsiE family protein [Mycobacterium sp.]|nr:phosphate-starvation-inducible PsiE family protein [Mycobacterium sp.]
MDAKSPDTRPRLSHRIGALVDSFETLVYAIAFLLLAAAAVLVVVGGGQALVQAATHQVNTLQGGVLVLDRVLMVLIIAEIAATLRAVLLYHEIAAEPFLFIGLIACVRRILIVTAATEQVQSDKDLNRLLLELGALGLLVIGIAVAIFLVRFSSRRAAPTENHDD